MNAAKSRSIDIRRSRKTRGRGLRATTGCTACRKRHVKCDEEKPVCHQCTRNDKLCIYPGTVSKSSLASTDTIQQISTVDIPEDGNGEDATNVDNDDQNVAPREQELDQSGLGDTIEVCGNGYSSQERQMSPSFRSVGFTSKPRPVTGVSEVGYVSCHSDHQRANSGAELECSLSNLSYTSPASIGTASRDQPIGVATSRWFDMLVDDADIEFNPTLGSETTLNTFGNASDTGNQGVTEVPLPQATNLPVSGVNPSFIPAPLAHARPVQQAWSTDSLHWQVSGFLTPEKHEQAAFDNFVEQISPWLDLFDPYRHFSSLVPRLAIQNIGLFNAILALSTRHISLTCIDETQPSYAHADALRYYNETLQYVSRALQYESYHTSDELLVTTLVVSAFEMLGNGSSREWERHLQGVFWIQRSQVIHGDSGGLRGAVWWAWLCQDIWAAFRDQRKVFSFWKPERSLKDLNPTELAARSVFVLARVINYCNHNEADNKPETIASRFRVAEVLSTMLDEWASLLTPEFSPLPRNEQATSAVFQPLWIHPPFFGVSVQVHHAARILLSLHRPSLGGLNEALQQQVALAKHVDVICGITLMLSDYASATMSSQCLFIAGLCTHDQQRRNEILRLLEVCRRRTGWPAIPLQNELRKGWDGTTGA